MFRVKKDCIENSLVEYFNIKHFLKNEDKNSSDISVKLKRSFPVPMHSFYIDHQMPMCPFKILKSNECRSPALSFEQIRQSTAIKLYSIFLLYSIMLEN